MSATGLFILTFAPMAAAAVLGMTLDAFGRRVLAARLSAALLLAGGVAGLWGGWASASETVFRTFLSGRVFSTAPGLIAVLAAITLVDAGSSRCSAEIRGSRSALVAFGALGAGLATAAIDLVSVLLALETAAVASYALVGQGTGRRPKEAALKYFVQGSVATGLLVAGIAVAAGLFASGGDYPAIREAVLGLAPGKAPAALAAFVLVTAALAFKAGAVPFHSWAPDAYQSAPAESAAFLATGPKVAAVGALALLITVFAPLGAAQGLALGVLGGDLLPVTGGIGLLSVVVGSVLALRQRSYTRMLGYAGVAQVGYALIAIASLNPSAAFVFISTYAIGSAAAFLAAAAFRRLRPGWDGSIEGLTGLGLSRPAVGIAVTFAMASLAGIPPFVGFWGKFEAFGAALTAAQAFANQGAARVAWLYGTLAVAGIVGSIVSVAYYGSVVRALFEPATDVSGSDTTGDAPGSTERGALAPLVVLAAVALAAGVAPLLFGLSTAITGFLLN